ncbi:MAG: hypothetical protein Harvfovirus8_25 [Harvfovirus sp.]|uniref:Uncharacterized protein n=1 Tax=Harvfovirus sp. TaxID=2487768 RepID=A0A3G5A2Y6_9VIRU|nr:MAG: hypothetical protein Harvfovirus8_25 [Harvfovirus sp.]
MSNGLLKNGQNLETLSGGERLQTVPDGQYYFSSGDQVERELKGPANYFKYNLLLGKNFGFLKNSENKCIGVGTTPGACDENNKNLLFTLTTDGRLFNYGDGKFRTASLCVDPNGDKGRIFITEIMPRSSNSISLWTDRPLSELTDNYIEGSWFNYRFAENCGARGEYPTCDCSCGAGPCPTNQTQVAGVSCEGIYQRRFCLLTEWPAGNEELCARGDARVKVDQNFNNKLDILKCKSVKPVKVCGQIPWEFTTKTGKNTAVWAPWSGETADSQDVVDFCSQHDSFRNVPFLDSSSSYPNCNEWCRNQERRTDGKRNRCLDAKAKYCSKYTSDINCVDYCKDSDICFGALKTFCQGDNLKSPVCQNYCNKEGVTCDAELEKFCKGMCVKNGDKYDCSVALKPETKAICGCFLPEDFYTEITDAITKKYNLPNYTPSLKQCYYPACSQSDWKPALERKEKTKCPEVNACIQVSNIDISGHFTGDITVENNIASCGAITAKPGNCKVLTQFENPDGKCVDCPGLDPKHPETSMTLAKTSSKYIKTCICSGENYLFDRVNKTCKKCPPGTILDDLKENCVGEVTCPQNQYFNTSTNQCENCKLPDQIQEKGNPFSCVDLSSTCDKDKFYDKSLNPPACNKCPKGQKPTANNKACEDYCTVPLVYDPSTGTDSCISCKPPLTYDSILKNCVTCDIDKIPNEGGIGCHACDKGFVVSADKTKCVEGGGGGGGDDHEGETFWAKYRIYIIIAIIVILLLSSCCFYFWRKR